MAARAIRACDTVDGVSLAIAGPWEPHVRSDARSGLSASIRRVRIAMYRKPRVDWSEPSGCTSSFGHQVGFTAPPQRGAAKGAEAPLRRAGVLASALAHHRVVDAAVLFPLDLQARVLRAKVDRIAAAPAGLSTDVAVAEVEGIGVGGADTKADGAAVARTFQQHDRIPRFGSPSMSVIRRGGGKPDGRSCRKQMVCPVLSRELRCLRCPVADPYRLEYRPSQ